MKLRLPKLKSSAKYLALITAILIASAASLRAGTTSMQLTGVGDSVTVGGVYVDPYTATVGGVANTSIICDDWSNNTYFNETWTATAFDATTVGTSAPPNTPMFGNNQQLYNGLAWLGAQLLANPTNAYEQTVISFAMWELTYGVNGTYKDGTDPLDYLKTYQSSAAQCGTGTQCYDEALSLYNQANGTIGQSYNSAGWEILNPDPGSQNNSGVWGTPQEFMLYVPAPETSETVILAGDLLLFGVAVLVLRRRGLLAINR